MTKEFKWTDELVREFIKYYTNQQGNPTLKLWGKDLLEEFKKEYNPRYKIISYYLRDQTADPSLAAIPAIVGINSRYWHIAKDNPKHWGIRSVRRESDNEVFTIGDHVCVEGTENYKIDRFVIINSEIFANNYNINYIQHADSITNDFYEIIKELLNIHGTLQHYEKQFGRCLDKLKGSALLESNNENK